MDSQQLLFITKISITLFTAILFLQSGFDKVFDFQGNKVYIQSVFSKTFLAPFSNLLFLSITMLEVATGVTALLGVISLLGFNNVEPAILSLILASFTLLGLFAGQRIAKDYGGAAGIVPYFLVAVFGLYLFGL